MVPIWINTHFTTLLLVFLCGIRLHAQKKTKDVELHYFWMTLVCCSVLVAQHILESYTAQHPELRFWRILLSVIGYDLRPVAAIGLLLAVCSPERRSWKIWIPAVVNCAVNLTAFFSPLAFSYDQDYDFVRGPLGYFVFIVGLLYMLQILIVVWRRFYEGRRSERLILICCVIGCMTSSLVDALYGGSHLNEAMMVGCIFLLFFLHVHDSGTVFAHIAMSLASGYMELFYVNLDTDEYVEYHTDEDSGVLTVARRGTDFFESCRREVKVFVHPDDNEAFVKAMDRRNLTEALTRSGVFEMTYRRMKDGVWFYVHMKVSRMEDDNRIIVIGVTDVDELMKQRIAQERMMDERVTYNRIYALTGNFIAMYAVEPGTERYHEFGAAEGYEERFSQTKEGENFFESARESGRRYVYPEDVDLFLSVFTRENVMAEIQRSGIFTLGYRLVIDGKPVYVQLKAAMADEREGRRLIVGINDVDAQVRREEEYRRNLAHAQKQAKIDALTGVKNRHAYLETEAQMNRLIAERNQPPFAVVMLDVNDLKKVNDTAGHQAGDQYLRSACKIICDTFAHSPVFRVGGDEFTVISQGRDYARIDELIGKIRDHNAEASHTGDVVIACGMSRFADDACVSSVFERADQGMYENKKALKAVQPEETGG